MARLSNHEWDKLVDSAFALDDEHPFFGSMLEPEPGHQETGQDLRPNSHALGDWDESKHPRGEHGKFGGVPNTLYRNTERGTFDATARFYNGGELGGGIYFNYDKPSAVGYGDGDRSVHEVTWARDLKPDEVGHATGGWGSDQPERITTESGKEIWRGDPSKDFRANRSDMLGAANRNGVKVLVGGKDHAGSGQVSVLDKSLLKHVSTVDVTNGKQVSFGDWEEGKHPRDERGRFATYGGFEKQALANLANTSRTAGGISDTSSSDDKPKLKAEGDKLAKKTEENFKNALQYVWSKRDMAINSPADVEKLITTVNEKVNAGLLQPGQSPWRTWATNYPTVPPEGIKSAMNGFYGELYSRLTSPHDPVANAAWAEQRINGIIHPFADGVGRSSKVISGWILARAGHSLPSLPDRTTYNKAIGSDPVTFERAYRSWFGQKHSEMAFAGDFDESKHPRSHGRFAPKEDPFNKTYPKNYQPSAPYGAQQKAIEDRYDSLMRNSPYAKRPGDNVVDSGSKEASAHATTPRDPNVNNEAKDEFAEFYHGTTKQALDSIMKNGLEPGHRGGADDWARAHGEDAMDAWASKIAGRNASVYITPKEEVAEKFARLVADNTNSKPVVLEVKIPKGSKALHTDEASLGNSLRWEGKIKPEWITKTIPVSRSGERVRIGYGFSDARTFYFVIPVVSEQALADWDESKHPRDYHGRFGTGGESAVAEHDPALAQFALLHGVDANALAETEKKILSEATTDAERQYARELALASVKAEKSLEHGDTKELYVDKATGMYKPEREVLHEEIIRNYLERYKLENGHLPPSGLKEPVVTFMSGMPGAGKTTSAKDILADGAGKVITIDPDSMKPYFPEYNHGLGSAVLARESGDVADKLMEYAARQRMNIVIDGTMKTSGSLPSTFGDGAIGKMAAFKDKGYRVEARFVDATVNQSITSTVNRFHKEFQETGTGRFVPLGFTRVLADEKYGTAPRRSFELAKNMEYKGKPLVDAWTHMRTYLAGGGEVGRFGTLSKGGVGR